MVEVSLDLGLFHSDTCFHVLDRLWPIKLENPERLSDMYESLIYHSRIFIHWQQHLNVVIRAHMLINPISYGILSFSQLPWEGGGGFLAHTPESTVRIIWLIPTLVHLIIGIKLEKVQNFRSIAVLFSEIWCHKGQPSEKGTSRQFRH